MIKILLGITLGNSNNEEFEKIIKIHKHENSSKVNSLNFNAIDVRVSI